MRTITDQIETCRRHEHPRLVLRTASGWLVMGPSQRLRGYCILLADPIVPTLNDLDHAARGQFLADMARAGDAVAAVVKPLRLNYEMLGNLDPTLHAHIVPRHADEPEALKTRAIWLYPPDEWDAPAHAYSEARHGELRRALADALRAADAQAPAPPMWQAAAGMAARFHQGQLRRDGRTPYISHPFRVALTAREVFGVADERVLAAALLHDAIEDTPADFDDIADAFGDEVAQIVAALTKDMRLPEDEREPAYDDGLRAAGWRAHVVKLADQYDNLSNARADGIDAAKFLARCRRAIAVCGDERRWPPEVARSVACLRVLMAIAEGGTLGGQGKA